MRRILAALAMAALLAGCQMSAPAEPAPEGITEQALAAEVGASEEAGTESPSPAAEPTPEPPAPVEIPPPPPEPPMLAQQRASCRDSGGQLMPRAPGLYACVRQTRDGGRSCDEGSDCQGLCLARSATCAPLTPLFGCHEVFTTRGRRETLCTD